MTTVYTPSEIERARQAAQAMLGVGPDPRDCEFWNTYLTVSAKDFAQLLDALNVPRNGVTTTNTTRQDDSFVNDWLNMNAGGSRS